MKNFRLKSMIAQQDVYGPPPEENSYASKSFIGKDQTAYGVPPDDLMRLHHSVILTGSIIIITIAVFIIGLKTLINRDYSKKKKILTILGAILVGLIIIFVMRYFFVIKG